MQIEVYRMTAEEDALTITLEAVCDTFSSLLWDIEYYKCGSFEVYIAANPQNIDIAPIPDLIDKKECDKIERKRRVWNERTKT